MTTDRVRARAIASLMDTRDAGGYTLPAELMTAADVARLAAALELPDAEPYRTDIAAAELLTRLRDGGDPDVLTTAERMRVAADGEARREQARVLIVEAIEMAHQRLALLGADLCDRIIVEHLQPAFAANLEQAEKYTATLDGHPLDAHSLITAPAPVRNAWTHLHQVAERYRALRQARGHALTAAGQQPEHDHSNEFATFADPHALTGHKTGTGARAPEIPYPTDSVELIAWLVGPARIARPWLPTVRQQDERWRAVYGDALERQRTGLLLAQSIGGR